MNLQGMKAVSSFQQNIGGSSESVAFTASGRFLLISTMSTSNRAIRIGINAVSATETAEDEQTWLFSMSIYTGMILLDLGAPRTEVFACSDITDNYQFTLLERV